MPDFYQHGPVTTLHDLRSMDRARLEDLLCELQLEVPELATKAARLLGLFGSPASQRALVSMASQHGRPLGERQTAAEALRAAVGRHGILLTTDEILLQYDRYNRSRELDAETQKVLSSILDTLESRTREEKES